MMTFRKPEIPEYLEVWAEQRAAALKFSTTELGRQIFEAAAEDLKDEENTKRANEIFGKAEQAEIEAFQAKSLAGVKKALELLESLKVDGKALKDPITAILKSPIRRNELEAARDLLFADDGA